MVGMVELQAGVSPKDLAAPVARLLDQRLPKNLQGLLEPEFASMSDYYLKDNNGAVEKMIIALSLAALFILLMAIINFININIGTSSYRLKEIGLRKVFGGARRQLIFQHLTESLVLTFIAGLLSIGLYELLRPYFNQILNASVGSFAGLGYSKWALFLLLILIVGCISGIYPAFVLSSSRLINSVKGKIDTAKGSLTLRKGLLIVQFSLAVIIFICALNVSRQVSYFFNKDIGYNKEQLLVLTAFPKQWDSAGVLKMMAIRDAVETTPGVRSASLSFEVPDRMPPNTIDLLKDGASQPTVVHAIVADEAFGRTFGLKVKQGSFFSDTQGSHIPNQVVVNETAAKTLGITAINQQVRMPSGPVLTVAGIVNDFNYSSFHESIGSLVFLHIQDSPQYRYLVFKIASEGIEKTIAALKEKWQALSPNAPFEYTFMDERFQSIYQSEIQLKKATHLATALNLVIVFMGVFGLMAFTLARRNKEIAVRKVLGADTRNIIMLFLKEYALLVVAANIIAWPLAWWATNYWLQNYTYRIEQTIIPYLSVFLSLIVITSLFISLQCYKASYASPIKSLRTE